MVRLGENQWSRAHSRWLAVSPNHWVLLWLTNFERGDNWSRFVVADNRIQSNWFRWKEICWWVCIQLTESLRGLKKQILGWASRNQCQTTLYQGVYYFFHRGCRTWRLPLLLAKNVRLLGSLVLTHRTGAQAADISNMPAAQMYLTVCLTVLRDSAFQILRCLQITWISCENCSFCFRMPEVVPELYISNNMDGTLRNRAGWPWA